MIRQIMGAARLCAPPIRYETRNACFVVGVAWLELWVEVPGSRSGDVGGAIRSALPFFWLFFPCII